MLFLCTLISSPSLAESLAQQLQQSTTNASVEGHYEVQKFEESQAFLDFVEREKHHIDCLILEDGATLPELMQQLRTKTVFLPTLILQTTEPVPKDSRELTLSDGKLYHQATLKLPITQISQIQVSIDEAISKFLRLSSNSSIVEIEPSENQIAQLTQHTSLTQQQRRLSEKLKERLGYLGVYYKRNPAYFFRHMSQADRQELLTQLKADYRTIILSYFTDDPQLNDKIDNFVNLAFFADISVAQIVEIHMELMDEFSKQLKLEGRSDEVLLDYRLTLIDTIAHLCEMYRRSIPRES